MNYDDGRLAQFEKMMTRLAELQSKYRGVRGELLSKVHDELAALKPSSADDRPVAPPTPMKVVSTAALPSCRACGRTMKEKGDGTLVCQNGHVRLLAG